MKKMLRIIGMFFVVAAVVFAAGCAQKATTPENGTPAEANQSTPAVISVTPTETPVEISTETPSVANNTIENVAGNNTSTVTSETPALNVEQTTGNTTEQAGIHMSNAQRKLAIAQNRTQSSSEQNISQ
jgi:type IV pilus biogenesis protein CpaD/CtpE